MLKSAQIIKKTDFDSFLISHHWFRVDYIIFCNLQILSIKTSPDNPITGSYPKKGKKRKEKKKKKNKIQNVFASIYYEC